MTNSQDTFAAEAKDLICDLETWLLELETNGEDQERVGAVFRALHTLKGSGGMAGYRDLERFAHVFEAAFERVRSGQTQVSGSLITSSLKAVDHLRLLLDEGPNASAAATSVSDLLTEELHGQPAGTSGLWIKLAAENTHIGFELSKVLEVIRALGPSVIAMDASALPAMAEFNPGINYFVWKSLVFSDNKDNRVETLLRSALDEEVGEYILEVVPLPQVKEPSIISAQPDHVYSLLLTQPSADAFTNALLHSKESSTADDQSRLKEKTKPKQAPSSEAADSAKKKGGDVKVSAAKLDGLVDLVGELVIAQARLTQVASRIEDSELQMVAEEVDRLCTDLRANAMELRMVPVGGTFSRFRRLVRDLAIKLDKTIGIETVGEDTELDKTVIDKLGEPMIHLIRNAVDHGIETPEERVSAGKNPQGIVSLSARYSDTSVVVEIKDDGRGLDLGRIRERAIEKGIISANDELSDHELYSLTLKPGFSTAKQVSNLSGRGVGMDAVACAVQSLRGTLSLDSTSGQGTTVSIRLPLTLAIIEGLLIELAGGFFVLPLAQVEECIEFDATHRELSHRRLVEVRGEPIPYIHLREWLCCDGAVPDHQQIVVINLDGRRLGFLVDHVVGQHQTVIKSLGPAYETVDGLSGATILGDGTVALVLDPMRVASMRENEFQTVYEVKDAKYVS